MDAVNAEEAPSAPSPSGRAAKRLRSAPNDDDHDGGGRLELSPPPECRLELPPELWAGAMEYLPFASVLLCGAVSRSMLHEAMPRLSRFRIDHPNQMNLAVASRFRDVEEIHINSLFRLVVEDEGTDEESRVVEVDDESRNRVATFLSRFDTKLRRVHFGAQTREGETIDGFASASGHFWEGEGYPEEGSKESTWAFLDHVAANFRCRALSQRLEIFGLCCPNSANGEYSSDGTSHCDTCLNACRSFPLESVLCFECRGSSIQSTRSGRAHSLDVCVERAQIESIFESRPGGRDLLRSERRLLHLLGRGSLYKIAAEDGARAIHIVKYREEQLDEIKRVIEYAELDVKQLSMQGLSDAVMRSFTKGECDPIPAKKDRYFSEASLDHLVENIGLNLDRNEIGADAAGLVEHARQIAWAAKDENDFDDILVDCLKLVRHFTDLDDPPLHQITDAIPFLVDCLSGPAEHKEMAVTTLKNILVKGAYEYKAMVLVAKPIPKFSRLLESDNVNIVKAAAQAVAIIVKTEGVSGVLQSVHKRSFFARLVNVLDSEDDECVQSALKVLVASLYTNRDHVKTMVDKGLFPPVVRLLRSPTAGCSVSESCSKLLGKVLEHELMEQAHVKQVLDSGLTSLLVGLVSTQQARNVPSHIQMKLLSTLVQISASSDGCSSVKAVSALGKIGDISGYHNELVLKAGIAQPLLQLLIFGGESALRVASETLAICTRRSMHTPRQTQFDFSLAKSCMSVATELLTNRDDKTMLNCCWALCNILEGLSASEIHGVINIGFVKRLVKLVSKGRADVQKPAMMSIYHVSVAGGECIQSIVDSGWMKCIRDALMFSPEDKIRELACSIVGNVVGDAQHIQAAIDAKVLPCVLQRLPLQQNVLSALAPTAAVKSLALKTVCKVTEVGVASQVKYLVAHSCTKRLCTLLHDGDLDKALVAIGALKNMLGVGKVAGAHHDVRSMERKIGEWQDEILRLQHAEKRVAMLRAKKARLEFNANQKQTIRLSAEFQRLKRVFEAELGKKLLFAMELGQQPWFYEYMEDMVSSYGATPNPTLCLAQVLYKIHSRHLHAKMKQDALRRELNTTLPLYNLPTNLAGVNEALKQSISTVLLLKAVRSSYPRSLQINEVELGLEKIFMCVDDDDEMLKTGGVCGKENFEGDSVAERLKRRKLQSITNAKKKARRKGPSKKGAKKE